MKRSTLKEKGLTKNFWAEVVACTAYLLNHSPTKKVKNMTPKEAWSGDKHDVKHLQVFGRITYAHVPESKGKKLDDRGEKCIFIGYSGESKDYTLFNPCVKKIVVSRNMILNEGEAWTWSKRDDNKDKEL